MSADVSRDASAQVWRVECEGGEVREVDVVAEGAWWTARRPGDSDDESAASSASARCAVAKVAARWHWPLVAILAPGEPTRAEAAALAYRAGAAAMRDACARVCQKRAEQLDAAAPDDADIDDPGVAEDFGRFTEAHELAAALCAAELPAWVVAGGRLRGDTEEATHLRRKQIYRAASK